MTKPRICEILGVEVGERFEIKGCEGGFEINETGYLCANCYNIINSSDLCCIINDPTLLVHTWKPNETEITILRGAYAEGARWIAQEVGDGYVWVHIEKPVVSRSGSEWRSTGDKRRIMGFRKTFDTMPTDRCFNIAELLGKEDTE